ncbi:MAG: response regulator transcription factor [Elusimicrobia bacterium]|nr:response regulator transcription factor [Elusimicrobiota bacterium]
MTGARILVVDDEPDFIRFLDEVLKRENYVVTVAETGPDALRMAAASRPDLVLLDWNLPGKDGLEVCRILKEDPATRGIPVIMLTSRGREQDVVLGLEMGAVDYVSKRDLRPRELVARVRAALRREGPQAPGGEILRAGLLALDSSARTVTIDGQPVDLRPKEFDLLHVFLKNPGRVLTRQFLEESVWGEQYFGTTRAIDATVSRLRGKLGPMSSQIVPMKGLGYKFHAPGSPI